MNIKNINCDYTDIISRLEKALRMGEFPDDVIWIKREFLQELNYSIIVNFFANEIDIEREDLKENQMIERIDIDNLLVELLCINESKRFIEK